MRTITEMLPKQFHTSSKGECFDLVLRKKHLSDQHNYWLYFVEATHKTWRKMGFAVFVTKQAFPNEKLADHLAHTLAMDEVKSISLYTTRGTIPSKKKLKENDGLGSD